MTRAEYLQIDAINWSTLKHGLRSAAHLRAALDNKEEKEPTEAQVLGSLAHSLILEGKNLLDLYAIKPEGMSFAKKEGKEWRDAQTKPILAEKSAMAIPLMAQAIANHPIASGLLRRCTDREHCVQATLDGVSMKGLLDASGPGLFLDVKTCESAKAKDFAKTVADFNYQAQMAIYRDMKAMAEGLEQPPQHAVIAVEKSAPYLVMVYALDDAALEMGTRQYQHCLDLYKMGLSANYWLGYEDVEQAYSLSLPDWAKFEPG